MKPRRGPEAEAQELLLRFLTESSLAEERRFRELCATHPDLERELQRLYTELRRMDALLGEPGSAGRARRRWPFKRPDRFEG
ncbi:MAG: hypothetical protein IPJ77_05985 [Planctomycetes bacterium]|nr:hypothetical protein [Planctomycetota bacterium]